MQRSKYEGNKHLTVTIHSESGGKSKHKAGQYDKVAASPPMGKARAQNAYDGGTKEQKNIILMYFPTDKTYKSKKPK